MSDDKPAFVARKFQDAQKLAAKGYSCPLCSDTFPADPKLWQHAKVRHYEELGLGDMADEEGTRKRFRREAIEKAYVSNTKWGQCKFAYSGLEEAMVSLSAIDLVAS